MLDAYIIEEIRKREADRKREEERPTLRIEIEPPDRDPARKPNPAREPDEREDDDRDEEDSEEQPDVIRISLR